jgi:hypothetical protein
MISVMVQFWVLLFQFLEVLGLNLGWNNSHPNQSFSAFRHITNQLTN